MVQLQDTTYANLQARARMSEELEAALQASTRMREELEQEILRLKAEKQAQEWDERVIELLRLQAENQHLREKLGLSVRRLFGPKSERTPNGQEALLFNEAEAEYVPGAP